VYELIRNDVFLLTTSSRNRFLIDLLALDQPSLRHAVLSLISIVVSTLKGVEYITTNDDQIIASLITVFKQVPLHTTTNMECGKVNHRFLVAILQKVSVKQDVISIFTNLEMIQHLINLVEVAPLSVGIQFVLDFSSALLANILHASSTQEYLKQNCKLT
jgi:hypothetical protein